MNNDFILELIARLDGSKTIADLKQIEAELNAKGINLKASIDTAASKQEIQNYAKQIQSVLKDIGVNIDLGKITSALTQGLKQSEQSAKKFVTELQKINQIKTIETWMSANSKAAKKFGTEINAIIDRLRSIDDLTRDDFNNLKRQFSDIQVNARSTGSVGLTFGDKISQLGAKFGVWTSVSSAIMSVTYNLRSALTEIKEIDTYLTEISKTNDALSKSDLVQIGLNSFGTASKYGKKATDYLSGVQEASRAGYDDAEGIAELSTAIQGAGDVTADVANEYVIATDKAYKLKGNIEALTAVFDGSNKITNENAVNMTKLAEGMTIVGSTAASFGVGVNETTAALGTMAAATQQEGSEVARAFRAILLNIRQVSDEEEGIDAEGLTKYEKACNALNVSLKETKNGIQSLRNPMEVLKELSVEYNKLSEGDIRRTQLLNSVGGKLRATQLDALLRNWDMYEKMLGEYASGGGSMAAEAEKTANSLEGSLNRVSNTWTKLVSNVATSDGLKIGVNSLNGILSVVELLTDKLGTLGTLGGIGGSFLLGKKGLD